VYCKEIRRFLSDFFTLKGTLFIPVMISSEPDGMCFA